MSHANVEIVKSSIDAYNRRDVEAFANLVTPDFELFTAIVGVVEGGSYQGPDGLTTYFEAVSDAWEEIRMLAEEFRDLGDSVLVLGQIEARGRASGVRVNALLGLIYDFRGGKISRIRAYLDHGEALRAAGLEG
jgi:ketosteroid isomerase-like protein